MPDLTRESDGRYVLDGRPIHAGDVLDVHQDGQWTGCRFEWLHTPELAPALFFGDQGRVMRDDDRLRWPGR